MLYTTLKDDTRFNTKNTHSHQKVAVVRAAVGVCQRKMKYKIAMLVSIQTYYAKYPPCSTPYSQSSHGRGRLCKLGRRKPSELRGRLLQVRWRGSPEIRRRGYCVM